MRADSYLGGDEEWCVAEGCKHRAERGYSQLCPIHLGEAQEEDRRRFAEAHERWQRSQRSV